jgi:hypothetical protein
LSAFDKEENVAESMVIESVRHHLDEAIDLALLQFEEHRHDFKH